MEIFFSLQLLWLYCFVRILLDIYQIFLARYVTSSYACNGEEPCYPYGNTGGSPSARSISSRARRWSPMIPCHIPAKRLKQLEYFYERCDSLIRFVCFYLTLCSFDTKVQLNMWFLPNGQSVLCDTNVNWKQHSMDELKPMIFLFGLPIWMLKWIAMENTEEKEYPLESKTLYWSCSIHCVSNSNTRNYNNIGYFTLLGCLFNSLHWINITFTSCKFVICIWYLSQDFFASIWSIFYCMWLNIIFTRLNRKRWIKMK